MFNPDTKIPALAACTYVIDEAVFPDFLPGVIFTDVTLSLEVWDETEGVIDIDSICFSEGGKFKIFKAGDWMFDNFTKAIYADQKWTDLLFDACKEAAE
jgi:hypothetical protein